MKVLLISTYELGRQPFGLASPAAWLRAAGMEVTCLDLAVEALEPGSVQAADVVALYVPMHTATRIAARAAKRVRAIHPGVRLGFYGLYASMNEAYLRSLGANFIIGGEFEEELVQVCRTAAPEEAVEAAGRPLVSLKKLAFLVPDRAGLPSLRAYARLELPGGASRVVGYTEASRGCKHLCRHCPIVPVYRGQFRIVQREVVLEDVRRQVAAGAEHITFGDPDFFNGVSHAVRLVRGLHDEFPALTYDVTIKVEHLLQHHRYLPLLRDSGCAFVTTAVESLDDAILARLDKGHTESDFYRVVELFRQVGLNLAPTFVPFTPWTTIGSYLRLLERLAELDLPPAVPPIQLAIRLLIPAGSRLLELPEVKGLVGEFDERSLCYPWRHPDPLMDELQREVQEWVRGLGATNREEAFQGIWSLARRKAGMACGSMPRPTPRLSRAAMPYLTEPWYC
ncbi:MAG: radical SAM protein [Planctomycetes bacterium]|nr:radical SAM protein [Planctomycetota bacterium]